MVGLYLSEKSAQEKYMSLSNKHCPLIFPCPEKMLPEVSGYSKRLIIKL
jgi:hypothetical protein